MTIGKRWLRMADLYRRFAASHPGADFSDGAALAMFEHETFGKRLPDGSVNGFALGKKWLSVTVAAWKEDIASGGLSVRELIEDGFPQWFLERVGVFGLKPTRAACAWWRG